MEKESALLPVAVLAEWVSGERECSTTSVTRPLVMHEMFDGTGLGTRLAFAS